MAVSDEHSAQLITEHVARQASEHFREIGSAESEVQAWLEHFVSHQRWAERLTSPRDKVICIGLTASGIDATAAAHINDEGTAQIGSIYVAPAARRRGLARQMVQELVDWATESGARWAQMETAQPNEPMQTLARQLGFELASTYRDKIITHVPFCVYRRSLTDTSGPS